MQTNSKYSHTIFLVDDEPGIIRSLKRLFRKERYHILTADSGIAALETLGQVTSPVSLIISDQRMPGMSGAQFLEEAKAIFPDAIRILLTGYSDMDAIVDAVNKGEIHRYLTKPWKDDDLLLQVRQAIKQYELLLENQRLTELTKRQNMELNVLNKNLEKEVVKRTRGIIKQHEMLQSANKTLEQSLFEVIRLVSSLVNDLNPRLGLYMTEVSNLTKKISEKMQMDPQRIKQIEMAALVHDIGLIGLSERIAEKDESVMSKREKEKYRQHPALGSLMIGNVQGLKEAAGIVLHHHERYDGQGFPGELKGVQIPIEARILAAAAGFRRIVDFGPKSIAESKVFGRRLIGIHAMQEIEIDTPDQVLKDIAKKYIKSASRIYYDPDVVTHLLEITGYVDTELNLQWVDTNNLIPGMTLTSDLRTEDNRLLLPKGTCLNQGAIATIGAISRHSHIPEKIKVRIQG